MTEDEAKTKWCPFARVASGEYCAPGDVKAQETLVGWNRREMESLGHRRENLCIGSACMAWRQTKAGTSGGVTYPTPAEGYCGLVMR